MDLKPCIEGFGPIRWSGKGRHCGGRNSLTAMGFLRRELPNQIVSILHGHGYVAEE